MSSRGFLNPLERCFVYFIIPTWSDCDNQNLNNFCVNTVNYSNITGTYAATTSQFPGKWFADFFRFSVTNAGFNGFKYRAGLISAQFLQIFGYFMVIDNSPGYDSDSLANLFNISSWLIAFELSKLCKRSRAVS